MNFLLNKNHYLLTTLPHVFQVSEGDLWVCGWDGFIRVFSRIHSQEHYQCLVGQSLSFENKTINAHIPKKFNCFLN